MITDEKLFQPNSLDSACKDCEELANKCRCALSGTFHRLKELDIQPTIQNISKYLAMIQKSSPKDRKAAWGRIALSLYIGSSLVDVENWSVLQDNNELEPKWVVLTLWNAPWNFDNELIEELGKNIRKLGIQNSIQSTLDQLEQSGDQYAPIWVAKLRQAILRPC